MADEANVSNELSINLMHRAVFKYTAQSTEEIKLIWIDSKVSHDIHGDKYKFYDTCTTMTSRQALNP